MSVSIANEPARLALTLVTRNFWPQSGAAELAVIDLACELARQGHDIDVITARWHKNWPASFQIRGLPVTRITRPGAGAWGAFRFQRQLSRSIAQHRMPDGIIVFSLGDETLGRVAGLQNTPIIVRVDYRNVPYPKWTQLQNKKTFASLARASAVAADSVLSASRLEAHGVDPNKIHVIPDGVAPTENQIRTTTDQVNARVALSNAHPILSIDPGHPLVVCAAPIDDDGGVNDLIQAWKLVTQEMPKAKLWLLGDGSHGSQIWNLICSLEQVYSIILPGFFDDLQTVFDAADLYVHPLRSSRACSQLCRAMNLRLCPVAVESEYTRPLIKKDENGLVTTAGNPNALAEAILHGLRRRDLRRRLGNQAQVSIAKSHSIEEQATKYLQLINPHPQTIASTLP